MSILSAEKEEKKEKSMHLYQEPQKTVRQILFDHHEKSNFTIENMHHEIRGLMSAVSYKLKIKKTKYLVEVKEGYGEVYSKKKKNLVNLYCEIFYIHT